MILTKQYGCLRLTAVLRCCSVGFWSVSCCWMSWLTSVSVFIVMSDISVFLVQPCILVFQVISLVDFLILTRSDQLVVILGCHFILFVISCLGRVFWCHFFLLFSCLLYLLFVFIFSLFTCFFFSSFYFFRISIFFSSINWWGRVFFVS
jgi:hypothetical protein